MPRILPPISPPISLVLMLFASVVRAEVKFADEIAPILVRRCLACHGEQKFKGEYQLHTLEALLKPGETGEKPIVPGKPRESRLLSLLREAKADERMPKNADALPKAEIELVEKWIAEGAKTEGIEPAARVVSVAVWKHPAAPEAYRRPFPVTALAFRPDGEELAVGGQHEITIWSAKEGKLLRRIGGLAERTYGLSYTKDGSRLAAACGSPGRMGEVKLLNPADGSLTRHFGSLADCAFGVAFSPDEKRLAACGADQTVRVFEVESGKEELTLKDHSDWVMSVAWHPEGTRLATAARDKTCKVFDAKSGELVTTFPDHGDTVYSIAFLPDGKHAVSCGADGRVRRWIADDPGYENPEKMDKKKKHQIAEMTGFTLPVHRLVLAGGKLFACSADLSVRLFDVEKKSQLRSWSGQSDWPYALDFHEASQRVAVAGLDGQVRIYRADSKDEKEPPVTIFVAAPGYTPPEITPAATGN